MRYLFLLLALCLSNSYALAEKNSVGMEMLKIPAGHFMMGDNSCKTVTRTCPKDDPATPKNEAETNCESKEAPCTFLKNARPVHQVTLTSPFYMSQTGVTQEQWSLVMGTNPSHFVSDKLGYSSDKNPVEKVSWHDAITFANALSKKEDLPACYDQKGKTIGGASVYTCKGYRLPTEAEFEYAARAGTKGARYSPLDDIAWYAKNSGGTSHPVGKKAANSFGLYDMLGNLDEWCHDWLGDYPKGPQTNPEGPSTGTTRVLRGGGVRYNALIVRAAHRMAAPPSLAFEYFGVRLVRTAH